MELAPGLEARLRSIGAQRTRARDQAYLVGDHLFEDDGHGRCGQADAGGPPCGFPPAQHPPYLAGQAEPQDFIEGADIEVRYTSNTQP